MSNPFFSPSSDRTPTEQTAVHHSRQREIKEIGRLWTERRLTLLHGSPGVGKTSLLHAGVIPSLSEAGRLLLPVGRLTHHAVFPLAALPPQNRFVFPLLASWSPEESPARLSELSIQRFLSRHLGTDRFGAPRQTHLCIDQAETLFRESPGREAQRAGFLRDLADALVSQPHLRLLLVLRTACLEEAEAFAQRLSAQGATTGAFHLAPLDRKAALRALTGPEEEAVGGRVPEDDWRGSFVDELSTIRAPDGRRIHTPSIDPSLFGIAYARLGPELNESPANLAKEVNRALGEYTWQTLAMVAADHRLLRSEVEKWFRETFVDPGPQQHAQGDDRIPVEALSALEDGRLIRSRDGSRGTDYEIQHPRLLEAVRAPVSRRVPIRRPDVQGRLQEAAAAFWAENFPLARVHVEGAVRACRPQELETRARAECLLGDLDHAEGRFTTAIRRYEVAAGMFEALRNTPLVGHLLSAIGRLSLRTDPADPLAALQSLYAAASRLPHDPHVLTALGQALWQTGQTQAAFAALNEVLTKDGDNPEALRVRGELHADLGEAESALQDLGRVDRGASSSALSAWALATALRAREESSTAPLPRPDELNRAVESANEGNGSVLLRAALVQELYGNHPDAAKFASRALKAQRPPIPPQLLSKAQKLKNGI